MKKEDKLLYLVNNYPTEYLRIQEEEREKMSERYSIFCICERLCTGLHESICRKFNSAVDSKILEAMKHYLPKETRKKSIK